MKSKKRICRRVLSIFLALSVSCSAVTPSFAADLHGRLTLSDISAPTSEMYVYDNIVTASAHADASSIPEMLGCNVSSGYSMVANSAPSNLADAKKEPMMAVWGTSLNSSPDPYFWNYFYNYYAAERGRKLSNFALINPVYDVKKESAGYADEHIREEYGGISASVYTRPDIFIGYKSTSSSNSDGYDWQVEKIHDFGKNSPYYRDGDEEYFPVCVPYDYATFDNIINSMYSISDAILETVQTKGKTTRYGNPADITRLYEAFVYGFQFYLLYRLEESGTDKKTVAVLIDYDESTGVFTLADEINECRELEYFRYTAYNLADKIGKTEVTIDELRKADGVIMTSLPDDAAVEKVEQVLNGKIDRIYGEPAYMSSFSGASPENALALTAHNMYLYDEYFWDEYFDWTAWYYQYFYHIADREKLMKYVLNSTRYTADLKHHGISYDWHYDGEKISQHIVNGIEYFNDNTEKGDIKLPLPEIEDIKPSLSLVYNLRKNSKKQQQKQKESFASKLYSRFFADPVDTLTGAHQIDLSYLTQSGAIDFQYDIHYDSSRLSKGRLGTGWYDSYEKKIEEKSDGTLLYYSSPTSYLEFEPESSAAGSYSCSSPGRTSWSITKGTDVRYTVTKSNDGQEIFDKNGRLAAIKDHTGKSLELAYTSSSIKITEPISGRTLTLMLDSTGKVTEAADAADDRVTFTYDSAGMLTSVTDSAGEVQSFTYDEYGHVLSGKNAYGTYFTNAYNEKGLVSTQIDAEGSVSSFVYEDADDGKVTICTDRNGNTSTIKYDKNGFLISSTDRNGNITSYTYDKNGNILTEKSPDGSVVTNTYSSDDKLMSKGQPKADSHHIHMIHQEIF